MSRSRGLLARAALLAALLAAPSAIVPAARAQDARAAQAPPADSLHAWSREAKARFKATLGDSTGGGNYPAYEGVGLMGRRLLRPFGRMGLLQAHALKPVLDSLGLDTEIATDPQSPGFALLVVRNTERLTADAVGFLYWYRGEDLRMQGVVLAQGGHHPRMRVWWTGRNEYPYEWGIVAETAPGLPRFTLLRLSPTGSYWDLQQDEDRFPLLGEPGEVTWADVNHDGRPELLSWTTGPTDSLFQPCGGCPKLLTERLFVEGNEGFELQDQRLLPSPYASFVYFVRLLLDGRNDQAARLLRDPAKVKDAVAQGWGRRPVKQAWQVEYGEQGQAWPRWLALRFQGPAGVKRYIVHFGQLDGRWIIEDWIEPKAPPSRFPSVTVPPAPARKKR